MKFVISDLASILVIFTTFVLFIFSLFTKGFTHELLLEVAVFLVSVKLILATQQIKHLISNLSDKIDQSKKDR